MNFTNFRDIAKRYREQRELLYVTFDSKDMYRTLPSTEIIDENQTVIWNRNKVQEINKLRSEKQKEYSKKQSEIYSEFERECIILASKNLPDKIAQLCWSKAYEDGHSGGFEEIAAELEEYVDFAKSILEHSKVS